MTDEDNIPECDRLHAQMKALQQLKLLAIEIEYAEALGGSWAKRIADIHRILTNQPQRNTPPRGL